MLLGALFNRTLMRHIFQHLQTGEKGTKAGEFLQDTPFQLGLGIELRQLCLKVIFISIHKFDQFLASRRIAAAFGEARLQIKLVLNFA